MRKLLGIVALLLALTVRADAGFLDNEVNQVIGRGLHNLGLTTPFVGPLDSLPAPLAVWSLRRELSAYTANKAIHVTCSGGTSSSGDVGFTGAGDFDATGYNTHVGTGSCAIDTWYDQSGNGNDGTQATGASRPTVTLNSANGHAVVAFSTQEVKAAAIAASAPYTINMVIERTGNTTTRQVVVSDDSQNMWMGFSATAGDVQAANNNSVDTAAADNSYHSFTVVFNGASSIINVDGTDGSAGSPNGSGALAAGFHIGSASFFPVTAGMAAKVIVWASGLSSGNRSALHTSDHTYYGSP